MFARTLLATLFLATSIGAVAADAPPPAAADAPAAAPAKTPHHHTSHHKSHHKKVTPADGDHSKDPPPPPRPVGG